MPNSPTLEPVVGLELDRRAAGRAPAPPGARARAGSPTAPCAAPARSSRTARGPRARGRPGSGSARRCARCETRLVVLHLLRQLARELDRLDVGLEGAAEGALDEARRASPRGFGARSSRTVSPRAVGSSVDGPRERGATAAAADGHQHAEQRARHRAARLVELASWPPAGPPAPACAATSAAAQTAAPSTSSARRAPAHDEREHHGEARPRPATGASAGEREQRPERVRGRGA